MACTMIVASLFHRRFGFFINWFGDKQGHGVEYHLLAIRMALSLIVSGGGMLSLDRLILRYIGN
jgi:putative oxidoreductase